MCCAGNRLCSKCIGSAHCPHAYMHACDERWKGAVSCLSWRVHSDGGSKHDQIVHENVCQQAVGSLLALISVQTCYCKRLQYKRNLEEAHAGLGTAH
jgi:hypothetical protein